MGRNKGWRLVEHHKILEVIPIGDTKRHLTGTRAPDCWCQPSREPGRHGKVLYGHYSHDGRELVEEHGVN